VEPLPNLKRSHFVTQCFISGHVYLGHHQQVGVVNHRIEWDLKNAF